MNGVISFDIDGVLANFTRGFTRIGHKLYGTPTGDGASQQTWMFEDFPELDLTAEMCGHPIKGGGIWGNIITDAQFWYNLDPFNVSVMQRINRIQNKVFITNRLGVHPLEQTRMWLHKWGIQSPKVIVASKKAPIAIENEVVAHIDDFLPNCNEIKDAIPTAFVSLLYVPYSRVWMPEWTGRDGDISLSVDHFIDDCEAKGLIQS